MGFLWFCRRQKGLRRRLALYHALKCCSITYTYLRPQVGLNRRSQNEENTYISTGQLGRIWKCETAFTFCKTLNIKLLRERMIVHLTIVIFLCAMLTRRHCYYPDVLIAEILHTIIFLTSYLRINVANYDTRLEAVDLFCKEMTTWFVW